MNRQTLAPLLRTWTFLLVGFTASPSSLAHAQYADFLRGSNLENSRPGKIVKASMATDDDGGVAILACVVDAGHDPGLVLWRLRADGSSAWSRAWSLVALPPTLNLAVAPDGSLVMTGTFRGRIDLGNGPLVSAGEADIFLAKLDSNGNHVWSRSFGAPGNDLGYKILVDPNGNIALAGKHTGVDFGGGLLNAPENTISFFRAAFGPDGTHLSSASFGSSAGSASINDMAINQVGDVYAIGGFYGTLAFGATTLKSAGSPDIVMVGFEASGNVRTAQRFGDEFFDTGYGIVLTPEGDLLTTGVFSVDVSLGGPVLESCLSTVTVFVARYSANGEHRWSRSNEACAYGASECTAIALHPSGGIAVVGTFTGAMQLDQASLFAESESMLAMRFDADGNLIWMGEGAAGAKGLSVVAKAGGNLVVVGNNSSDLEFCTGGITKTASARGFAAEFADAPHVDGHAPTIPANPTYDGTTVAWDASTDPEGASVRYRVEEKRDYPWADRVTIVSHTSLPVNAVDNQSLFIYVTALDCFDHASEPSIRLEIHPSQTAPLAPGDVHFEGGSLVWTNPTDADVAGVAVDGTNIWGVADTVRLAMTVTPALNVENLSYRYYYVRAVDASGNWGMYALLGDQAPPPAPTGLVYAIPKLAWDASKDTGFGVFMVYASRLSDFSQEKRLLAETLKNEFEVPIDARDSYYHVVQMDLSGNMSAPTTVAGQGGARPARPRSLAYRNGRLSWKTTDTDIDRYDIFASTTDASEGPRVLLGSTSELEFLVTGEGHAWYHVVAIDEAGQESVEASVSAITGRAPSFTLSLGVLSNPFRGRTTLQYSLPGEGPVSIAIYDVRGAHVATLVNGIQPGGSHYVDWGGVTDSGGEARSGVYFARLQFRAQERTAKLILLR